MKTSEIRKMLDDIDNFLPRDYDPTSIEFSFNKAIVLINDKQIYGNVPPSHDMGRSIRLSGGDIHYSKSIHKIGYDIEWIYVEVKK